MALCDQCTGSLLNVFVVALQEAGSTARQAHNAHVGPSYCCTLPAAHRRAALDALRMGDLSLVSFQHLNEPFSRGMPHLHIRIPTDDLQPALDPNSA